MRILFTRFPLESARGGAENQTLALMKGLGARGHAIAFLGSCPALLSMCREEGIPCVELSIGPPPVTKWGAISFAWRGKRMRKQLIESLKQFSALDATVMLSLSEKILLTKPATERGIRVLWLEHDPVGRWLTANPWLSDLRRQSRFATTICVSELSRRVYLDLGFPAERVVAIPNGIDVSKWTASSGEWKDESYKLKIGCVARAAAEKGVDVLIEAVANLPNVTLEIVGSGREEQRLRGLIASHSHRVTSQQITITPRVDDLASFYRSLDVFILPSRTHDPFGLVAAEAMACGVPVIVTDACGIAGYLEDGKNALVVKAGSAEELRTAIERMRNEEIRTTLKQKGPECAYERFNAENMMENYNSLLCQPHSLEQYSPS